MGVPKNVVSRGPTDRNVKARPARQMSRFPCLLFCGKHASRISGDGMVHKGVCIKATALLVDWMMQGEREWEGRGGMDGDREGIVVSPNSFSGNVEN